MSPVNDVVHLWSWCDVRQVLDYPTQQAVLMPLLAWAYALQVTGRFMAKRYRDYICTLDLTLLPEVCPPVG